MSKRNIMVVGVLGVLAMLSGGCAADNSTTEPADDDQGDYGEPTQDEEIVGGSLVPKEVDAIELSGRTFNRTVTQSAELGRVLRSFRKRLPGESPRHCMGIIIHAKFLAKGRSVGSLTEICGFGTLHVDGHSIEVRQTSSAMWTALTK